MTRRFPVLISMVTPTRPMLAVADVANLSGHFSSHEISSLGCVNF
jgi:hypothetical protein